MSSYLDIYERCQCGTCGRFIRHIADFDPACSKCYPVFSKESFYLNDWVPVVCKRCVAIMAELDD